ncbi:MAG TPA: helix-turn-helix domain-containing protein [Candidatus Limnocylindrales bacterium]
MTTRTRPVDRGTERGRRLRASIGAEIRGARVNRNLTLKEVGRAIGVSAATGSRVERGVLDHVDVMLLARMCAVIGLDLSIKAYPGGDPIRDAAHLELLRDFRALLHPSIEWAVEVPLPVRGDSRAWDGFMRALDWRYGVEAETAPRDGQATLRRVALKQRDGQVDGVVLLVRDTAQTRAFLREIQPVVGATFPISGMRAQELLRVGANPGGSAIVVLPRRPLATASLMT